MNAFFHKVNFKLQIGTWIMSGNPIITEVLACAGYDFLVIDAEHGPGSIQGLLYQIHAVESRQHGQVQAIVRCPSHDPVFVKQAMDIAGVENFMFPMVTDASQAEALVSACRYAPEGSRGVAKMIRAAQFGLDADYIKDARNRVGIIAQVETPEALENAVSIGSVDGINSVFIGPGDLAVATGYSRGMADDRLRTLISDSVRRCREAGVVIGTVMPTPALAHWFLEQGGSYVAIASDLALLLNNARVDLAAMTEAHA